MKYINNLLKLAKKGDVKKFHVIFGESFEFPYYSSPFTSDQEVFDKIFHIANNIQDKNDRFKLLHSLIESFSLLIDDIEQWDRRGKLQVITVRKNISFNYWYISYKNILNFTNHINSNKSRIKILISLFKVFMILIPTKESNYLIRKKQLNKYKHTISEFIQEIDAIKVAYWKTKALEEFADLIDFIYSTEDSFEFIEELQIALDEFKNIEKGYQIKIEELERLIINLSIKRLYFRETTPWQPKSWILELETPNVSMAGKEAQSRFTDFTFFFTEKDELGDEVPRSNPLQNGYWYQLEVAVRKESRGIPVDKIKQNPIIEPKQEQDVTIFVTAEGDGFEICEPVQTLILPPFGDSSINAYFKVQPLKKSISIDDLSKIKVRLYYEFNLLEEVVIHAEIVGKFDKPNYSQLGLEMPFFFKQEELKRGYLDFSNVQPRKMHIEVSKKSDYFQFNFFFRNEKDQELVFTTPIYLSLYDLEDDLISIRNIWYDIAMSKTFTEKVQGNKNEFLLNIRKLAKVGRGLWIRLFKQEKNSSIYKIGAWLEKHPLKSNSILQVSFSKDATNFVFPWSLVYDRPVPRREHELPDLEGFWGTRYCIEQLLPRSGKITDEPNHIKEYLKLEFMLWQEFRNANKQKLLMNSLVSQSGGTFKVSNPPIIEADICYDLLKNCNSQILYFYTHGYTRHRHADIGVGPNFELFIQKYESFDKNSPQREFYKLLYESVKQKEFELDRSWIELSFGKLYLDELYDFIKSLPSNPLVILNMCESAQITSSLSDSFIHFFLDRGARSVIGTECPMTIEFADPFAEELLKGILAGEQIGKILLNIRRHFLKLKNPLGLAYSLFGSATTSFILPEGLKLVIEK